MNSMYIVIGIALLGFSSFWLLFRALIKQGKVKTEAAPLFLLKSDYEEV